MKTRFWEPWLFFEVNGELTGCLVVTVKMILPVMSLGTSSFVSSQIFFFVFYTMQSEFIN